MISSLVVSHALVMARDVFEGPLEIFLAVGLIADEWMEIERHDPTRLLAVLIKLVELIDASGRNPPPINSCRRAW
jgi:hypothetical protein